MIRAIRLVASSLLVLCMLFTLCPAGAQTLDDYKGAVDKKGCASIPYENYRDDCEKKQADVERWCKTEVSSCKGLETMALKQKIDGMTEKIKSLKEDRDNLNSQKTSAADDQKREIENKITDIEKQIYDMSKELDFSQTSLTTDISDIDKRIYNGGYCLTSRDDVQGVFKSAASKADGVSDSDIKPYSNQLIEKWETGRQDHEKALQNVKDGLEYCKKCKSGEI